MSKDEPHGAACLAIARSATAEAPLYGHLSNRPFEVSGDSKLYPWLVIEPVLIDYDFDYEHDYEARA